MSVIGALDVMVASVVPHSSHRLRVARNVDISIVPCFACRGQRWLSDVGLIQTLRLHLEHVWCEPPTNDALKQTFVPATVSGPGWLRIGFSGLSSFAPSAP